MDIEKAKKVFEKYINGKDTMKETLIKAIEVLLNELDKDNNIISDLQNEVTLKQCELDNKDDDIDILLNRIDEYEKNTMWKYDVKEALDKKDKTINEMVEQLEVTYNNGIYTGQKATEEVIKDAIKQLEEDIQYSANPLSIDNSKFAIKILKNILEDEEENK